MRRSGDGLVRLRVRPAADPGKRPVDRYHNRMTPADRLLAWLIRANAAILLLAAVPVVFPTDLMARTHADLGLGEFARNPLTEYLTRSAAACYAMHGGMVLLLSADVRRYRPMIPWLYRIHLLFAATVLCIDLFAGMPAWWAASEAGTIATVAVVILAVNRWADRVAARGPAGESNIPE